MVGALPAGASTVSGVAVSLSTPAAGAAHVGYTVDFTTSASGALADGTGTITFTGPVGTAFGGSCATFTIPNNGTAWCPTSGSGTRQITGIVTRLGGGGPLIAANTALELTLNDMTNATTVGAQTLSVATSSDTTATTGSFSLAAPLALSGVSVALSTPAASASHVDYTVDFTTSASGALASNYGTVTFTGPLGTAFSSTCLFFAAPHDNAEWCPSSGSGTRQVTGVVYNTSGDGTAPIAPNTTLELTLREVTSAPTTGGQTLTVATSSDTAASGSFSLSPALAVGGVAVSLSTPAVGASHVDYTVDFTTSASGWLADGTGTITFTGPVGTAFGGSCELFSIPNDGTEWCPTSGSGTRQITGVVIHTGGGGTAIAANTALELTLRDTANATTVGAQTLSVSTSSDTIAGTGPFSLVASQAVSGVSAVLSTSAAGAAHVNYAVQFTTSATGALASNYGTVTFTGPVGTTFASSCVFFAAPNDSVEWCPSSGTGTRQVTGAVYNTSGSGTTPIAPNTTLALTLRDTTNATTTGAQTLSVSTSSDTAASGAYSLTPALAVGGVTVATSTQAAGAAHVDYTVDFTTSATGWLADGIGTVTFTGPVGTSFGTSCVPFDIPNNGTEWCPTSGSGTRQVTGIVYSGGGGNAIAANTALELTLRDTTNTTTTGAQAFSVSTSSDTTAGTASFPLTTPRAVSGLTVSSDSTLPGQSGVSYTVNFTTSATGALADSYGTVTLTGPPGTVFTNPSCEPVIIPTGAQWCPITVSGTNVVTGVVYKSGGIAIGAGQNVELTVHGVTNTSNNGIQNLTVSTSSDIVPAPAAIAIGPLAAPLITSGNGATFQNGTGGTFTVTATGVPIPTLSSSSLPSGVTFTDNNNGTATLSASPTAATNSTRSGSVRRWR